MIKSFPDKVKMVNDAFKNNQVLKIFDNKNINNSGCIYISNSKKEDNDLREYKAIVLILKKGEEQQ